MRILLAAFCMVTMLFCSHCVKNVVPKHLEIDSLLLNSFNYKVGSYWVYKDSLTGELDSFSVIENKFSSIPVNSDKSLLLDGITMYINQYSTGSFVAKWEMGIAGHQVLLYYHGKIFINYSFFLLLPIQVGILGEGHNSIDSAYVASIKKIDTINSSNYSDVVKYRHFKKDGPIYDNIIYYNCTDGIIKLNLNQEDAKKILELYRYKVLKK